MANILFFSPSSYLAAYPDVQQSGMDPYEHYLSSGKQEGRLPKNHDVITLDEQLWGSKGKSPVCVRLHEILNDATCPESASWAAWALARYAAFRQDWEGAVELLCPWWQHPQRMPRHIGPELLEVEALIRTGHFSQAQERLFTLEQKFPRDANIFLARCNLLYSQGSAGRLDLLNKMWAQVCMIPISNHGKAENIDNLTAQRQNKSPEQHPLVSVIVPTFNAEKTLYTSLFSLAQQTWSALEVIIVNDASTDSTLQIAQKFVHGDTRFKVMTHTWNSGAYAARNTGLAVARGEFITTQDADDWSHPERIERQVQELLQHPERVACTCQWVRCSDQLYFESWRMEEGWIHRSVSSLLFRRGVYQKIGFWDTVRVEADTEYWLRIRQVFGETAVSEILPGSPLMLGRSSPQSLTRTSETHLITQFAGPRHEYREAAINWHKAATLKNFSLFLPKTIEQRPFPVPPALHAKVCELQGQRSHQMGCKNILLVGHAAGMQLFGGERSLLDILRGLAGQEINVALVLPHDDNTPYIQQLLPFVQKIFIFPYAYWSGQRSHKIEVINNFITSIHQFNADIVYINTSVLWEPMIAAHQCRILAFVHVRELPEHDPELCTILQSDAQSIRQHILSHADVIIANSQCTARWLNAPDRVCVIHNALDHFDYPPQPRPSAAPFRVALMGSNTPKKGLEDFANLTGILEKYIPQLECLCIGPHTEYTQKLQQDQHEGRVSKKLHFTGYSDDCASMLASCHILVNLSHFEESFGRTVLEGMLLERPVVCYQWGALPELVRHGETGFLVPYGEVSAVAQYICILYHDPILQKTMGENGRIRAICYFGHALFQKQLCTLLRERY